MESSIARVLIAEDSPNQRAHFAELLRADGLEVHEAPDGRVALDVCRIIRPDLLILDLAMPRLDGRAVLERLRRDRKVGHTPVIVLTADERELTVSEALDAGATDFIVKPARPTELLARVRRALREKANVDELLARNRALVEAAEIDVLTGLPNRRACAEALASAVSQARQTGRPMAVALIDVDHFKKINDSYGHAVGDQVLCALAGRLRDRTSEAEIVGRWGGEEFIAVMSDAGPQGAASTAEALREACAVRAIELGIGPVAVTVSVGWASASGVSLHELVERADMALYEAKACGRNCVRAAAVR